MAFKKKFNSEAKYVGLRDPFLLEYTLGKKVLHVGCTDWPFSKVSLDNESLLHAKLSHSCKELMGLDIDESGIDYLKQRIPGNYICGNLINENVRSMTLKHDFDIILIPDVIEHVPNQFDFLSGVYEMSLKSGAEIIFTTPNVYAIKSNLASLVGLDFTHTDHRSVHNESTLTTSVIADFESNVKNYSFSYASRDITVRYGKALSLVSRLIDNLFCLKPHLADTIIIRVMPVDLKKQTI